MENPALLKENSVYARDAAPIVAAEPAQSGQTAKPAAAKTTMATALAALAAFFALPAKGMAATIAAHPIMLAVAIPGLISVWGIIAMTIPALIGLLLGNLFGSGAQPETGGTSAKGGIVGALMGAGAGALAYIVVKLILGAL
jgi:hypothetical protein